MKLTSPQTDRACGVLLASAVGDALGAGYELGSAPYPGWPEMIGGGLGGFAPGEWTDDTAQALGIARIFARGWTIFDDDIIEANICREWARWFADGPADVGIQTARVFTLAGPRASYGPMRAAAKQVHEESGRSAGNGALMRTGPVALSVLGDSEGVMISARRLASLTHFDPVAGEAAALWSLMIEHAVLHGELARPHDLVPLLGQTTVDWPSILDEAESHDPSRFTDNGWVVGALQAAWSAIVHTPVPETMPCRHLQHALATAIGIGHDTDTVAAIAGALLGARWGASAVPQEWQAPLHGWGVDGPRGAAGLVSLATRIVRGRRPAGRSGWPECERVDYRRQDVPRATARPHPLVDGVWIGGATSLDSLPYGIDAVVSLCRVGTAQVSDGVACHAVRLLDTVAEDNPNLDFVIDDAARTVLRLRDEGRTVYLHCVAAHSRTPTVAARVAVLEGHPLDVALREVVDSLPAARPQGFLVEALRRLEVLDASTSQRS